MNTNAETVYAMYSIFLVSNKMQMYYNNINAAFPSKSIQRHVFEKNLHEKLHAQAEVMCSKPKKEEQKSRYIHQSHKNKKGNRETLRNCVYK